jgi:hypothetical protein
LIPRFAPDERIRDLWNEFCALFVASASRAADVHPFLEACSDQSSAPPTADALHCREIDESDADALIGLLTRGFNRKRTYWLRAWNLLAEHRTPEGYPRFGYLLEWNGVPVGVLLLIFTPLTPDGGTQSRCNVSSWYVEPAFRSFATILSRRATRWKQICYFNISPASHTWPMLEAEGYTQFTKGGMVALLALSKTRVNAHIQMVSRDIKAGADLSTREIALLLDHAGYGCLSLICEANGERYPFVFRSRHRWLGVSGAHLVYCRDIGDLARFAAPLGRFLARHGFLFVTLNSNGPVPGLTGYYRGNTPKYAKCESEMRIGDLAYSELGMFGY